MKGRRYTRPIPVRVPRARINHEIKASEVRVLDDQDVALGVMPTKDALKLAEEKGLDLVEVAEKAVPPVVKIISHDKFRYQQEKKAKQALRQQKAGATSSKRIQISVRAQEHDLMTKAKQGNKFLEQGHQLEVMMTLRGREKGNKDFAKERLLNFIKTYITAEHQVISSPRPGGRGMTTLLAPKARA